jgi:hypothetical protein
MARQAARESAYAELVAGLLDAREDVATARFDAELAAAEQDGRIDAATARTLRWWQRAAVRAVVDHARVSLPPVLAALDVAHGAAVDEVAEAARALDDALATAFPETRPQPAEPGGETDVEPVPAPEAPPHPAEPVHRVDLTQVQPQTLPATRPPDEPSARRLLVAGLTPLPPT